MDEGPFTWNEKGEMVPLDTRQRIRLHRTGEGRPFEELPYNFGPIRWDWRKARSDLMLFIVALGGGWVGLHHFAGLAILRRRVVVALAQIHGVGALAA